MVIIKSRSLSPSNWPVYHSGIGNTGACLLDTTASTSTSVLWWNNTSPSSSVVTLGTIAASNTSGATQVMYSFHSVSGYSSIGSYTGNGSATGPTVTTGFKPAFVLIKSSTAATGWAIVDNTRSPTNPTTKTLFPDLSNAEYTSTSSSDHYVDLNSNGFQIKNTNSRFNANGQTFIYMAFADTRDATFFGDTSGNGNNWTPNALNNTDVVLDAPVSGGNFAVMNPLHAVLNNTSVQEGNLKFVKSAASTYAICYGSMGVSSGKYYYEINLTANSFYFVVGFYNASAGPSTDADTDNARYQLYDGSIYKSVNGTSTSVATGKASGVGIIGVAIDCDNGEVSFYHNNTLQATCTGLRTNQTYFPRWYVDGSNNSSACVFNFGQDSSFAGNETPQGNTDDNGVGDFYYAPPSGGYLALTTGNLPTPTITAPDDYFNTVLYTGNGSTQSITGVGFQPDWVWQKTRSSARSHYLQDVVRGAQKQLISDSTGAETSFTNGITSFDSDGFSVGSSSWANGNNETKVAWNWLAGGTAVSNTDGTITSQVSANTDAGFSIVSYTGNNTSGSTIGHSLSSAPEMIIVKNRSQGDKWAVYHASNTSAPETEYLVLNSTNATADAPYWADTAPTSTVFSVGFTGPVNQPSENYIAYCFHSVEGYSKIGSYTGNGSTNFVHCGFRPAWIMIRRTNTAAGWGIFDNRRNPYNSLNSYINANSSGAEASGTAGSKYVDFLSNGFKCLDGSAGFNASGDSYIFLAFAEAPFKSANAR